MVFASCSLLPSANLQLFILVQANCISSQTKQDVLIACNAVLLAIQQFAREAAEGNFQLFDATAMSSRFCEHVFQALRASSHTSDVFTLLGASRLLSHCAGQLELEAQSDLPQVSCVGTSVRTAHQLQSIHAVCVSNMKLKELDISLLY